MMAPTMAINQAHAGTRKAWIAALMGRDEHGLDPTAAAAAGRDEIVERVRQLELPGRLRDVGVKRTDSAAIAHDALEDRVVATNPRPVISIEEVIDLLETAH